MFQQIIYINLKHRKDRLENVLNQISKIKKNNNVIRIDAINGKTLDLQNLSQSLVTKNGINDAINNNLSMGIPLTRGAIGCALSHREAFKKIIEKNINAALIVEDDISINELYNDTIHELYMNKPDDYDIIYLGYHDATIKYIYEQINDTFCKAYIVYGLFGYIVTNNGAKKLLDIFPISKQIDSEISYNFHNIKGYIVSPNKRIIQSDESEKNIQFGTDIQIRELYTNNNQKISFRDKISNRAADFVEGFAPNKTCFSKNFFVILFFLFIILFIFSKINGSFKKLCYKIIPI